MLSTTFLLAILLNSVISAPTSGPKNRHIITTTRGVVTGTFVGNNAVRWTIPYGRAERFSDPSPISSFSGWNASITAPNCAQDRESGLASTSEDCLFMNIYAPAGYTPPPGSMRMPVMVYLHGGTYVSGSNNAPGIDGSILSGSKTMIVVTVSYRLGLLGFMSSDSLGMDGNYGIKDVILALQTINKEIGFFGGSTGMVTLVGQSSGAEMIKSLMTIDSTRSLFNRAILHSAPLDFADHSPTIANAVGDLVLRNLNSNCTTKACLQQVPISDLLEAQSALFNPYNPSRYIGSVSGASPFSPLRPRTGGLIPFDFGLISSGEQKWNYPKSIIFTSVKDEACKSISNPNPNPNAVKPFIDPSYFEPIIHNFLPDSRADTIIASGLYSPSLITDSPDPVRDSLVNLGTDYIWNCPIQQTANNISSVAKIYVAKFFAGQYYSTNPSAPRTNFYCFGKVAHEDDIYAIFGTSASERSFVQKRVSIEVIDRWVAFIITGSPNGRKYKVWNPIQPNGNLNLLQIGDGNDGSSSLVSNPVGNCNVGLWGNTVPFDEQLA